MKNITSRGFAAMEAIMTAAAASIDGFGLAMRQRTQLDARSRAFPGYHAPTSKPKNLYAGSKLAKKALLGTLGAGMHSTNRKGAVDGVMVSPKKDISKGPAFTLSVRGKSREFKKRAQQQGQQFARHFVRQAELARGAGFSV